MKFFTGAVDELRAAYRKSEGAPTAAMGSTRESAIVAALRHLMPTVASVHHGEVIDRHGRQSGQLDGIVVHATGAVLATTSHESPVALAEGVLAVIEAKSTLTSQWGQVRSTWSQVAKLRRAGVRLKYKRRDPPPETAIPFIVIGRKGWGKEATLQAHAQELFDSFGEGRPPSVMIAQLEPPGFSLVRFSKAKGSTAVATILSDDDRWQALAGVWGILVNEAHRAVLREYDWGSYVG